MAGMRGREGVAASLYYQLSKCKNYREIVQGLYLTLLKYNAIVEPASRYSREIPMNDLSASNSSARYQSFWMPFTANRVFKQNPRLLPGAKGMYYEPPDARLVLDGTAGLWCVNAGHGRERIADAVAGQIRKLDYASSFQLGHPLAFECADRITALAPRDLNYVFFGNSGSEAVDSALKIALAYHRAKGDAARVRLVGRERAYHGVGFGGVSVGGIAKHRVAYAGNLLPYVDHLPATHHLAHQAFTAD